jgi:cytochrome c peroxidase
MMFNFFNSAFAKSRCTIFLIICLCLLFSCKDKGISLQNPNKNINERYHKHIKQIIFQLEKLYKAKDIKTTKQSFLEAKKAFKQAEIYLAFQEKENYKSLNGPNLPKIHEEEISDIKILPPMGFQVLEELIFGENFNQNKIKQETKICIDRLKLIEFNSKINLEKHHVIWLLQEAVVRMAATGLTGFDSPVLSNSLHDAQIVYEEIHYVLTAFKHNFKDPNLLQKWTNEIKQSQKEMKSRDFDSFDRYGFIKNHSQNQLKLIAETQKDWQVKFPFAMALNPEATKLFDGSIFNALFFIGKFEINPEKIALGKTLFNDASLSKNNQMSCATCHQESKAFTDGLAHQVGQKRNSPTLNYVALQRAFFYTAMEGSLTGQMAHVIKNPAEFNTTFEEIIEKLKSDKNYKKQFQRIYKELPNKENMEAVLVAYLQSLSPFTSKFDKNMVGKENSLTANEIAGFNLFMGKASCATCHFSPLFNGTIAPEYLESEMEVIGVPESKNNPKIDQKDLGRYDVFKTPERKFFFKTPTIRNIEKTAPYMHNGVFTRLEEVIDFYNDGGANGRKQKIKQQTLPDSPLNLSVKEKNQLRLFLLTLTDKK